MVALNQDKKSATVALGLCSTRSFPTAPLGLCSARSDYEVSLDPNKKSPGRDSRSSSPTFICEDASRVVLPPADEPGKGETREGNTFASGQLFWDKINFELSRDEARVKVREIVAMVDRWHDRDDWKPWTPPTFEDEVRSWMTPTHRVRRASPTR